MSEGPEVGEQTRIETFASPSPPAGPAPLDLQPLWLTRLPSGRQGQALTHPWGPVHRPDWIGRGLIVWPRGGGWCHLRLRLARPDAWRHLGPGVAVARLVLRWWADQAELAVDGAAVVRGDLFDTACRWPLPETWWQGEPLDLDLRLRSPLHDDGALIHSRLELEPLDPADPHGLLQAPLEALAELRRSHGLPPQAPGGGRLHLTSHAHLDLAWLWPVADTWQAAVRTFDSVLDLMERFPALRFGHSTPALYAWLERHRPALYARVRAAMQAGRWEPLNGPWVETDAVLVATASLLRQFQEGQLDSRRRFPEWSHHLAWLPDSFGFAAGLPAVAAATGVRWFCTHKLFWNADNPFPHRLFRWRSRCGAEVLALMSAPIGTDGDPLAIECHRLDWQRATGWADALWLPGVGDHGGGPSAEMLEQLELWNARPEAAPQRHGTVREFLAELEPQAAGLPVWRDELYLELHRGCATTRPDQKRHNRSLERLLREAETAFALLGVPALDPARVALGAAPGAGASGRDGATIGLGDGGAATAALAEDWRTLLFQQFHDILPGTSIPEVFEQAGPLWNAARRRSSRLRDAALLACGQAPAAPDAARPLQGGVPWWAVQLQPLPPAVRTVRLPAGQWIWEGPAGPVALLGQPAPGGGQWIQLPGIDGVGVLPLRHSPDPAAGGPGEAFPADPLGAVTLTAGADGRWQLANGLIEAVIGPAGVEGLRAPGGPETLAGPLAWQRWGDRGEFWDAWDLAADHRDHPLPWRWHGSPRWLERGPLCCRFLWRGRCGSSPLRLDGRLLAGSPWLELVLSIDWRQRHELLRLELPLAQPADRWAADTSGGVIERPGLARLPRERSRWEVAAVSWIASVSGPPGEGLAVLLDGPQGVSGDQQRLGVSLLRGPTWPDPGADNGHQRQRLALMPVPGGWRRGAVPRQARRFREPLWCRPHSGAVPPQSLLPALAEDLEAVAIRPATGVGAAGSGAAAPGAIELALQNLGPCRRRWHPGPLWRVVARLDGLGGPLRQAASDELFLNPWELGFWRLEPAGRSAT
jgi:alpha-mannosidase